MLPYTARSHRGCVRETNEDRFFVPSKEGPLIFAVADGMGGHAGGEVASSLAIKVFGKSVRRISENFQQLTRKQAEDFLLATIQQANRKIVNTQEQYSELKGMGTTLTAAFIQEKEIIIGHVGDSQAFIFRDNSFFQLTEDHSLVMELLKNGEIAAEELYTHPQRNLITRFLGFTYPVSIDLNVSEASSGDFLLLCTDGLTAMLCPAEIGQLLFHGNAMNLDLMADELLSRANDRGGQDNITFVLIHF
ncbi:MAG TPA: Stp1/IreP family PP2C-type Ser/Thr phosphatase [Firmicutes bacterium]|nr:Stp1/IreP family PP2C-type Ser/Thr phosphatase [Bacillota bacterium]